MDLSTLARVRTRLGFEASDTSDDTLLQVFLSRVSESAAKFLNRKTLSESTTEQLDIGAGQRTFHLKAYPIASVTTIKAAADRDFSSATSLATTDFYTNDDAGMLHIDYQLSAGRGALQVVYVGGMAANAAAFVTAFPDIADAIDEQTAFYYQRREAVGVRSENLGGGSYSVSTLAGWLPSVLSVLEGHQRRGHA